MNGRKIVAVTGQQAALFGGPLYVPFKVLGALALARPSGGRAVYWVETNDADFEEVNHVDFLDAAGEPRSLALARATGGRPIGEVLLEEDVTERVEELFRLLPPTEWSGEIREELLEVFRPGRTWGDAHFDWATRLYAPLGLEIFRPDRPDFRAFSKPFLLKEIEGTVEGEQANAFLLDARGDFPVRRGLFRKKGRLVTREGEAVKPENFDLLPNVKTRSVIQDAFFSADFYVAGPGEMAYLSDMKGQYDKHDVKPARPVPRMSAVLATDREKEKARKLGTDLVELASTDVDVLAKKVLGTAAGVDLDARAKSADGALRAYVAALGGLGLPGDRVEKAHYRELGHVLGAERARLKKEHAERLERLRALSKRFRPFGKPAERVASVIDAMNRFGGKGFLRLLAERHDFAARELIL